MSLCPCGNDLEYSECCEKYISGQSLAPTAEALMRSRYSAYVKQNIDYIAATHDPKDDHEFDAKAAQEWASNSEWLGLEIRSVKKGQESDTEGTVEFIANYNISGRACKHHEIANFIKDGNRWIYTDGTILSGETVKRDSPKIGRNDPCLCGSGKKYKKCCLNK